MGYPTVLFNASTGSDTAASGAGPATALTGSAASYSGSVFTLDGSPDLSGVAADSTHVIFVQTSTGRKFFEITAVDNGADTVTVANAPAGTSTGLTWAIGGKRATFDHTDSRILFSTDRKAFWTLRTETDQTLNTSKLDVDQTYGNGLFGMVIEGDDPATPRVINQTANAIVIGSTGGVTVRNLKFTNSNGTKTNAFGADCGSPDAFYLFVNCVFGDATNQLLSALGVYSNMNLEACVIQHCTSGQGSQSVNSRMTAIDCQYIHNGGTWNVPYNGGTFINCLFADTTGAGLSAQPGWGPLLVNCTFADNSSHGLELNSGGYPTYVNGVVNCIFANNGGYGVNAPTGQYYFLNAGNNYYNNTSGARNNMPAGLADQAVDPQFTDSAGGDWSIGANLKAGSIVGRYPHATTVSHNDVGAVQREEPAGGGGVVIIRRGGLAARL